MSEPLADDLARALLQDEDAALDLVRRGWSIEDQCASVVDAWQVHRCGGTRQRATDRELYLVRELIAAGFLPESARDYFERLPPGEQAERESWLLEKRESRAAYRRQTVAVLKCWREHPGAPLPLELLDLERFK